MTSPTTAAPGGPVLLPSGVVPWRPLTLADVFNGAAAYVRANPRTTFVLTTAVVVVMQLFALLLQALPLHGLTTPDEVAALDPATVVAAVVGAFALSAVTFTLSNVLVGMLSLVVGHAVFGATPALREVWRRLKGRLVPLIGQSLLVAVAYSVGAALFAVVAGVAIAFLGALGLVLSVVLALVAGTAVLYLWVSVTFAPVVIVLERLPVFAAIGRSFRLTRRGFWRVLAIRLLAAVVFYVVGLAVAVPFSLPGDVLRSGDGSWPVALTGWALLAVGGAVAKLVTAPLTAGVVTLLYVDRRIRGEAFDLLLRTGTSWRPGDPVDDAWLPFPSRRR
ncbi:hypothetical protein LV457_11140 [Mycobacterium sp. MYCO198283]|uniref:hypothetical protein n=1 Tax=Mycobacterium sp. MYCO198283 TaxID=2883505 RepID=UPI001E489F76|nr:hypothetical protein [Mycobacterium sp. MYCO198283]MCG5432838.1 hypothetical protein [Mycobacterium sp. MYCO198283]